MSVSDVLGPLAVVGLIDFVVFAFRQGSKVKPDPDRAPPPNDGGM